jgi:hypothetical protein
MDGPVRTERGEVQTWRYSLPNVKGEGWVIAFVDSTGCFSALSDWGDVAYRWSAQGWGPGDFREFLLRADDYYLTSKFGRGRKEYDPEGTLDGVKSYIIEARRDGYKTKEEAREEWDRLDTYEDLRTEFDFTQWYMATKLDDPGEFHRMRYVGEVTAFIKHAMPRLREVFRAELKEAA